MKVWQVNKQPGLDALQLTERPKPQVKSGEVLIEMRAAALNYRDLLVVKEAHEDADQPVGVIPISDGAGEIVEVGDQVKFLKLGDRVTSCFMPGWDEGKLSAQKQNSALGYIADGVLAEYVALSEYGVISIPDHLSFEEASTLPCAALTAWNALMKGKILPGKTVLIQGTGGVSIFALQFAKLLGARVVALSGSDTKLQRLNELGACLAINYKTNPNWEKQVMDFTNGHGIDHIIEVGGADTLSKSLTVIKYEGTISIIGHVSGNTVAMNVVDVLRKGVILQGIYVGSREMFKDMNDAIALHKMKPIIDKSFPFEQAKAAMEYLESGAHFGKVCISM